MWVFGVSERSATWGDKGHHQLLNKQWPLHGFAANSSAWLGGWICLHWETRLKSEKQQKQLSTSPKLLPSYLLKWPQRHKNHKTQSQQISQNGQVTHEEIKKSSRRSKIRQNIPSRISTSFKNLPEIGIIPNFGLVKWWNMVKPRHGTTQFLGWSGSQKDHPT